jgi:hypothetical protein
VRTLLLLLLLTVPAHAGSKLAMFGLGSARTDAATGWVARMEGRFDWTKADGDAHVIFGNRFGFEAWSAGDHGGVSVPIGWYAGAQVGNVRSTLGVGFGLWTFETSKSPVAGGISPFASASLEGTFDKLAVSLDARITRQVVGDMADFNVISVMVMAGKRWP